MDKLPIEKLKATIDLLAVSEKEKLGTARQLQERLIHQKNNFEAIDDEQAQTAVLLQQCKQELNSVNHIFSNLGSL